MTIRSATLFALLIFAVTGLRADQIEMQNGDRYAGKVLSMTSNIVVLQSEMLGKLTLPRTKVANINLTAQPLIARTNATPHPNLAIDTNTVEMIRRQFLSDAGPEANSKFDDLTQSLFSGKFDIEKLRKEAKTAADNIRELKKSGDVGEPFNSYLAVLDKFLKDSESPVAVVTNKPAQMTATH